MSCTLAPQRSRERQHPAVGCFCVNSVLHVSDCRLFETHPECKDVFFLFRDVEDLERLRSSRELRAHGLRSVSSPENVNIRLKLSRAAAGGSYRRAQERAQPPLCWKPVLDGRNPTGLTLLGRQLVPSGSHAPCKDANPCRMVSDTSAGEYISANKKPFSSASFSWCLLWENYIQLEWVRSYVNKKKTC